ncbi:hypothetical protein BDR26DRAFT_854695 [Obelidium mucronatum]|nr:hypothetical protein BDR26DRAFT_854695 [Obelidium mucronatum]
MTMTAQVLNEGRHNKKPCNVTSIPLNNPIWAVWITDSAYSDNCMTRRCSTHFKVKINFKAVMVDVGERFLCWWCRFASRDARILCSSRRSRALAFETVKLAIRQDYQFTLYLFAPIQPTPGKKINEIAHQIQKAIIADYTRINLLAHATMSSQTHSFFDHYYFGEVFVSNPFMSSTSVSNKCIRIKAFCFVLLKWKTTQNYSVSAEQTKLDANKKVSREQDIS